MDEGKLVVDKEEYLETLEERKKMAGLMELLLNKLS